MRPQDIAILLKIATLGAKSWQLTTLAGTLHISLSEISESLNRSMLAGLIDQGKKRVHVQALLNFFEFGLRHVFPQSPGTFSRGLATAHSHAGIRHKFTSEIDYVWPDPQGISTGLAIEPLYPRQAEAARQDPALYKCLALIDMIRLGRVREQKYAIQELRKELAHKPAPLSKLD